MTALKLIVLCALLYTAQARFPKALQDKWGYLDSLEFNNSPRVVGGQDAALGEAPYQISLLKDYIIVKSHMCGGSFISEKSVLTAAHCTDGQKASGMKVRYGTNKRSSSQFPDMSVSRIAQHENYNGNTIENDISILILASPITPSANVKVIEIATENPADNSQVKVYGWGLTDGNSQNLPENLQVGELTVVSNKECNDKWGEVNTVTDGMICALDSKRQACNGDSGGPLVQNGKLVGVVSWGPSKCPPGEYMSVYTRPNYYADWIKQNKV
uniref:Sui m 6 allergen n=1 Tax=Suidasia medanensis TaxID=223625 RepID=B2GM89_9ACAR|nr:Sui m 6 allergen [Suidasia medanensis]